MISRIKRFFSSSPAARPVEFDFERAKRRSRIAIIDDDPTAMPIDELLAAGYPIQYFTKIDAQLLNRCENDAFDIIVLDYNGVAPRSITQTDGFGIFDRIRTANPNQYVIAISAQTYDIQRTEFFQKANSRLAKPTDLIAVKQAIDTGIRNIFDKGYIATRIQQSLMAIGVEKSVVSKVISVVTESGSTNAEELVGIVLGIIKLAVVPAEILSLIHNVAKSNKE